MREVIVPNVNDEVWRVNFDNDGEASKVRSNNPNAIARGEVSGIDSKVVEISCTIQMIKDTGKKAYMKRRV